MKPAIEVWLVALLFESLLLPALELPSSPWEPAPAFLYRLYRCHCYSSAVLLKAACRRMEAQSSPAE